MVGAEIFRLLSRTCISLSKQKPAMVVKICFHCVTCLCAKDVLDFLPKGAINSSIVQVNLEAHREQVIDWLHSVQTVIGPANYIMKLFLGLSVNNSV